MLTSSRYRNVSGLIIFALILQQGCVNLGERTTMTEKCAKNTVVVMETSHGIMEIELFDAQAPISVSNFLAYVDEGFYDGVIFHRVIPGFMIQGGGFNADLQQKATRAPIKNEAANGLKNDRGTLAMARTMEIDSATAQFFINVTDNAFLNHGVRDYGYAVFAKVTAGMEVADKIAATPTTVKRGMSDVPAKDVIIKSMRRK
jgi:peptidyl-prolyl cis-trans isomerase A (cyclophilin A)